MRKFLAVVKREYLQRVRTRMFILATTLAPLVISLFGIVPALIFSIKAGGPVRIAVVDQTGKIYERLYNSVQDESSAEFSAQPSNQIKNEALNTSDERLEEQVAKQQELSFALEEIKVEGRSLEQIKLSLSERVRTKDLDGYLILPKNLLTEGKPEFVGRNTGDLIVKEHLEDALNAAVGEARMAEANIDVSKVRELSRPLKLQTFKVGENGAVHDSGEGFILVFGTGFIIYLTILMYGQVVLGAIIEEKETRIAEILFSSVRPFTLMIGKLIGVSLVALTQLAIWGLAFLIFVLYGTGLLTSRGLPINIPNIPAIFYLYFALFFLLGYFIYATVYALLGSVVTTAQEGGQLAMPIILLLVVGFYLAFPVIQRPDSRFAFWVSLVPFFSPITMLVRIVTQTPPFWQILLSLVLGFVTVISLLWLAARIYRIGMLMYGKRATLPEVWRWVRQQ